MGPKHRRSQKFFQGGPDQADYQSGTNFEGGGAPAVPK